MNSRFPFIVWWMHSLFIDYTQSNWYWQNPTGYMSSKHIDHIRDVSNVDRISSSESMLRLLWNIETCSRVLFNSQFGSLPVCCKINANTHVTWVWLQKVPFYMNATVEYAASGTLRNTQNRDSTVWTRRNLERIKEPSEAVGNSTAQVARQEWRTLFSVARRRRKPLWRPRATIDDGWP